MASILRAEWPHITPDSALVQVALPDWREKTTVFVATVLGSANRAAFKASATGTDALERLESEGRFLVDLAQKLTPDAVRTTKEETLEARNKRRGHEAAKFLKYEHYRPPEAPPRKASLADELDSLMREGMELLDELMAPAQAEETSEGTWMLEFGEAPAEWSDKADAFYKKIRDLLAAENPELIPDFEKGFNERLQIQRESARETPAPDQRSSPQKALDFATDTQRTPARIVEACLEGLSYAKKAI